METRRCLGLVSLSAGAGAPFQRAGCVHKFKLSVLFRAPLRRSMECLDNIKIFKDRHSGNFRSPFLNFVDSRQQMPPQKVTCTFSLTSFDV
jgi:hypothetical protein